MPWRHSSQENYSRQLDASLQVNLWGLDAIKTKGESVAVALCMVGARPVREGTGRIARHASLAASISPLGLGILERPSIVMYGIWLLLLC